MADSKRYDPEAAKRVLERAARIQAEDEGATGDVSSSDLLAAAEQAGISAAALRRAMAEERGPIAPLAREHRQGREGMEIRIHRAAPLSEDGMKRVWDVAIRERGDLGQLETLGHSHVWRPRSGPPIEVGVRRGADATDVWVRGAAGEGGPRWLPWLVFGLVVLGGARGSMMLIGAIVAFFGTRWLLRWRERRRAGAELERLAAAIEAELASDDGDH